MIHPLIAIHPGVEDALHENKSVVALDLSLYHTRNTMAKKCGYRIVSGKYGSRKAGPYPLLSPFSMVNVM